jgi:phage baseplate assembly protein W
MATEEIKSFLGTGWSFPPTFDNISKTVRLVSDEEDINESLEILLNTRIGERVMLPKYGCDLNEFMFESITTSFKTFITDLIRTAIIYYEPRIKIEKIDLNGSNELEGLILINIQYVIKSTNSRLNYVYPFYRNEGTEIK